MKAIQLHWNCERFIESSQMKRAKHSLIRVVDESGEDYLYPERFFVSIKLPQAVKEAFLHVA